ncbi:hypothetical protein [Vibrio owensii]|uniref:hypothetical protein n=1 Tax=Vibrio owensii TaxID=696485 RepID=UPI0012680C11|nr:hypothetical protein [Vibrio owensii]
MRKPLKLSITILLSFLSSSSYAADTFSKELTLSAKIERSKFFSYKITKFGFDEEFFELDYNFNLGKFNNINTLLQIKTDIPTSVSNVGYDLMVSEAHSECKEYGTENVLADSFGHYYLSGEEIEIDDVISYKFSPEKEQYQDSLEFAVEFDELPVETIKRSACGGAASIVIGLDF